MLDGTRLAVLIIVLDFVLIMIPILSSLWSSMRLEREQAENKALREENKRLVAECVRLKSKIGFYELNKDTEKRK